MHRHYRPRSSSVSTPWQHAATRGTPATLPGRRLLLRRPSGFDLHSVRDYEQGKDDWREAGLPLAVAVNISATLLHDPAFADKGKPVMSVFA